MMTNKTMIAESAARKPAPESVAPEVALKLLGHVRDQLRLKHSSIRTEQADLQWVKRYILFHDKRHPVELGKREVQAFLTSLAVRRNVASATQARALSAPLFLFY